MFRAITGRIIAGQPRGAARLPRSVASLPNHLFPTRRAGLRHTHPTLEANRRITHWITFLLTLLILLFLTPSLSAAPTSIPSPTAQGYLYVEPYQVRFEALFDAATILHWLDPNTPPPATLSAGAQKDLTEKIAAKTASWCRIAIAIAIGAAAADTGAFRGASVIKGKPANTIPLEPGAEVATAEAMVGLSWEFASPPIADQVTVEWRGFIAGQTRLPIRVFFGPQSETLEVTTAKPTALWQSQGRMPPPSPLAQVPDVVSTPPSRVSFFSVLGALAGAAALIALRVYKHRLPAQLRAGLIAVAIAALILGTLNSVRVTIAPPHLRIPAITEVKDAEVILTPLLRNVYRAFDQRSESVIYDTLARSVHGELLRQLYLETIQALTLDGREGTRVTIRDFDATIKAVQWQPQDATFTADCQWTALGTVGHWGHTHTRLNRYTAKVTVAPIAQEWKITRLDVTESRRL